MSTIKMLPTDKFSIGIKPILAVLGVFWLIAAVQAISAQAEPVTTNGLLLFLLGAATWVAAWQGVALARSWVVAARVLRVRMIPTSLWRQCMQQSLKSASLVWGCLALGVASLLLVGHSTAPLVTSFGLMALVVCLGTTLLFAWMQRIWRDGPPARAVLLSGIAFPKMMERFQAWSAQYTALESKPFALPAKVRRQSRPTWHIMLGPVSIVFNSAPIAQSLGSTLTAFQIWMMGCVVLFSSTHLVCKNLHWRMLLAPGGMHRGRLGSHIALSSATFFSVGFAVLFCLMVVVAGVFFSHPWQWVATILERCVALPFQVIFAICVGTLIRGTGYPARWFAGVCVVWIIVGIVAYISAGSAFRTLITAPGLTVDWTYLLSLLGLSALAVWASNKLWTVERLMQSGS